MSYEKIMDNYLAEMESVSEEFLTAFEKHTERIHQFMKETLTSEEWEEVEKNIERYSQGEDPEEEIHNLGRMEERLSTKTRKYPAQIFDL